MKSNTKPAIERNISLDKCLSFTISGDWGHFRRIDGNVVKETYKIIPRTTVSGLISAVIGLQRDSYYEYFQPETSAIAIQPNFNLRTLNLPENVLTTSQEGLEKYPKGRGRKPLTVTVPNTYFERQQQNYEMLVKPEYRIDCWLAGDMYDKLKERLESGYSEYAPSLGISECLAKIEYHGEFDIHSTDTQEVISSIPQCGLIPKPGVKYSVERSPGFMQSETSQKGKSKRKTTGFIDWTYATSLEDQLMIKDEIASQVDNRPVVFV